MVIKLLCSLINDLRKLGYNDPVDDVLDMIKDYEEGDTDGVANIDGLRGDVVPECMSEGFTADPFFSKYGPQTES